MATPVLQHGFGLTAETMVGMATPFMSSVTKMDILYAIMMKEYFKCTIEPIGALEPRKGALEDCFEEEEKDEDYRIMADIEIEDADHDMAHHRGRSPARERDSDRGRDNHRFRCTIEPIGALEPRKSALEDCFEKEEKDEDYQIMADIEDADHDMAHHHGCSPARERDRGRGSHRYRLIEDKANFHDVEHAPASVLNPRALSLNVDLRCVADAAIGVIDSGGPGSLDLSCFSREPICNVSCEHSTRISSHGFVCASMIASKRQELNIPLGDCSYEFEGVVPDAQLYFYPLACEECKSAADADDADDANLVDRSFFHLVDLAREDKVLVISMSQGPSIAKFKQDVKSPLQDEVGKKLLEVFNDKILTCVAVGNDGPIGGTALYGLPWVITVGACTTGHVLVTDMEIAVIKDDYIQVEQSNVLREVEEGNKVFLVIATLQGVSLNLKDSKFLKFRILNEKEKAGKDCVVVLKENGDMCYYLYQGGPRYRHHVVSPKASRRTGVAISRENTKKIFDVPRELRKHMYLRCFKSRHIKDERGVHVADISSRGPSEMCRDNITPDVVAPGHAILTPYPPHIPLSGDKDGGDVYSSSKIMSGTSLACPQVAAAALILRCHRPEWKNPSIVKSALITTASSLSEQGVPGTEFAHGAGLINVEQALHPGLVYEENAQNFYQYRKGDLDIFHLNLPTFAAALPHSHERCTFTFHRELMNIDEGDAEYRFDVQYFHRLSDDDVHIEADSSVLKFKSKERKKYRLQVEIRPRPWTHVSAMIKWIPIGESAGTRCPVKSPMLLYHGSGFDE